jgi:two-component system, NtrC family, nitrogen regulation response regulator GlnG
LETAPYPRKPILVVDDDRLVQQTLRAILRSGGVTNVEPCMDARQVAGLVAEHEYEAVLLDLGMPYMSGQEVLPILRESSPATPIVVITGNADVATAVTCMRLGASDYLVKPMERARLLAAVRKCIEIGELRRENDALRSRLASRSLANPEAFSDIVTADALLLSTLMYVETIAPSAHPVLITGETGVGKDIVARIIHRLSGRSGELVNVNIAGLDDTMLADTLFGHRKGAFTGAESDRGGLAQRAAGGTLFLDEVGDVSLASQVKLLRLLESGEYYQLGSDVPQRTDARVVAATNTDIDDAAAHKRFRRDLLYRLKTHHVHLPPLRDREGDVRLLADYFAARVAAETRRQPPEIEEPALAALERHPFPGNVRELRALIVDAVSRARGPRLRVTDFDLPSGAAGEAPSTAPVVSFGPLLPTLRQVTEMLVDAALERSGGNQSVAARLIGVTPQAVSRRIRMRRPPQ